MTVEKLEEKILELYEEVASNYNSTRYDNFKQAKLDLFENYGDTVELSMYAIALAHDLDKKELRWKTHWLVKYIDALDCMVDLHKNFKELKLGPYSKSRFRKMDAPLEKLQPIVHEQTAMGFMSLKEKWAPIYAKFEDKKEAMHKDTREYFKAVNDEFGRKFSYKPIE